jgi:hypothetical protein
MAKKSTTTTATTPTNKPAYVRVETGGLTELEGLLTGISACAEVAKAKYDGDHLNFHGLAELADRALFVLYELQGGDKQKAVTS